ncbi:MAG TPA: type II secretion system F family protein [Tepidisphaeraceae bacterium]|jgi:type II secretory pathway component PulF|nr:type II secretion system F family protein [Tepidisphaeraceae bacterium]
MSVFSYTAIGRDGRQTTGTLSAESRSSAISQVVSQGLQPVKLDEQKASAQAAAKALVAAKPGKVSAKAVENFTRELANLLAGGVSLSRSMSLLRREASNPSARYLWSALHDDVIGGKSLGDAMAKHPKSFSSVYIAMVRAGEAGGFLDLVLAQIAEFRTREQDLKGKVKAALIYPVILAFMATAVVIFLLTYFIPQFSEIFQQFGGSLPPLTQVVIGISTIVRKYFLFVAAAGFFGVVFTRRALNTNSGKRKMEQILLGIPIMGSIVAHFALVRFSRMLGTLIGAGVPLVASLKVAREAIGNQTLADTVSHAIEEVQRGEALSKALGNSPRLFPASVVETIAVAEETGRLDKELVRLATSYEGDLDRQLRMMVSVAEPLLLFVMAALIGTIVVAMLLPIFKLPDLVK